MFILAGMTAMSTGATILSSPETIKTENIQANGGNTIDLRTGKLYSNGDIEFTKDPDFQGTKIIPHGNNVVVSCDYQNVDTLVPGEFWKFKLKIVAYGNAVWYDKDKSVVIEDALGPDDSQEGEIKITIPLEILKEGVTDISCTVEGWYKIPWLNISHYCYEFNLTVDVDIVNNPPTSSTPEKAQRI